MAKRSLNVNENGLEEVNQIGTLVSTDSYNVDGTSGNVRSNLNGINLNHAVGISVTSPGGNIGSEIGAYQQVNSNGGVGVPYTYKETLLGHGPFNVVERKANAYGDSNYSQTTQNVRLFKVDLRFLIGVTIEAKINLN